MYRPSETFLTAHIISFTWNAQIPEIPIAHEPGEAKKQKNRKPKVTTTAFKDSIMKKTYKIRFHVNLKESNEGDGADGDEGGLWHARTVGGAKKKNENRKS